jgi:hypothetical protein
MAKEYAVFVEDMQRDLVEGREISLTIKDLTNGPRKYENRVVKAIVCSSSENLPGADILRIRSWTGVLYPHPWFIKIIEELEEVVPGVPHGETLQTSMRIISSR